MSEEAPKTKPPVYQGPFEIVEEVEGDKTYTEVIGQAKDMRHAQMICNALNNEYANDIRTYYFQAPKEEDRYTRPPDMVCGSCGGRLVPKAGGYPRGSNTFDPNYYIKNNYTHADAMFERHAAWPVELWEEED